MHQIIRGPTTTTNAAIKITKVKWQIRPHLAEYCLNKNKMAGSPPLSGPQLYLSVLSLGAILLLCCASHPLAHRHATTVLFIVTQCHCPVLSCPTAPHLTGIYTDR